MSKGGGGAGVGGRSGRGASRTGTASAVAGAVGAAAGAGQSAASKAFGAGQAAMIAAARANAAAAGGTAASGAAKAALPAASVKPAAPAAVAKAAAAPTPGGAKTGDVWGALKSVTAASGQEHGLQMVSDVRAKSGLSKEAFDRQALKLARDEKLVLHYKDDAHMARYSDADRAQWVHDPTPAPLRPGGTYYVGMAKRRSESW